MRAVYVRKLTFSYPMSSVEVLKGLDLTVYGGEFLTVVGDSGSGKSTLLKILSGISPFNTGGTLSGVVNVLGENLKTERGREGIRGGVFYLHQEPEYYLVFSTAVAEATVPHLEKVANWSEAELKGEMALRRWLGWVKPEDRISYLSGGEKQRLALSHMEASEATLYLLDEPLTHLDIEGRRMFYLLLKKKLEDGATVILTTPTLRGYEELKRLAPRVVYMKDGKIQPSIPEMGKRLDGGGVSPGISEARIRVSTAGHILISVKKGAVTLGGRRIFNHLNLVVRRGEVVVVRGKNGSGKTTLIRLLLGFISPESGKVSAPWLSEEGRWTGSQNTVVGYLPQNPMDLFTSETLYQDLLLSWRTGRRKERFKRALKSLIKRFHLEGLESADPYDFSTGERQRAALASVFIRYPDVVFLDEPTRGMDETSLLSLKDHLYKIKGRGTILITTHTNLFYDLADRNIILRKRNEDMGGGDENAP